MAEQFDVDSETHRILLEKAQRRAVLREQFQKLKTDPFKHVAGESGAVFDPAIQRYQAMKVSGFEYFKPSAKNGLYGVVFMVLPMFLFGYCMHKSRSDLERSFRRGEVAYKDRRFKLI